LDTGKISQREGRERLKRGKEKELPIESWGLDCGKAELNQKRAGGERAPCGTRIQGRLPL